MRRPDVARLWTGRSALVLFGVLLALLCVEGGLRLLGPRLPGLYNLATFQRAHPEYGFFHQPGARGWTRSSEFTAFVQINSRGLRDDETQIPKPEGTFRVLVLGDSMVEGAQVALEQTVPKQLERLLGGGQGGIGRDLDSINAGNAGFGTAQEILFLEREGPVYQPDLVVLVFYVDNDAANNSIAVAQKHGLSTEHRPFFELADDGSLRQIPRIGAAHDALGTVDDFLRAHLLLYSVTENLLTAKAAAKQYHAMRMGEDPTTYKIEATREWRSAWAVTERLLHRARASADALGAELLVVCAPSQFQIDDAAWRTLIGSDRASVMARYGRDVPNRRLEEAAGRAGVRYLDLLPGMLRAAQSDATPLYFEKDGHWTPAGHAVAARLIASYVHEHGLLIDEDDAPRVRTAVSRRAP